MPRYQIVVTDVTCYGSLYCVAGWDLQNGGMIRPEPHTTNANSEASRFWSGAQAGPGQFFSVGNVVEFDANLPPGNFPFPHATEDRVLTPQPNAALLGQYTLGQTAAAAQLGIAANLPAAFGAQLIRANSGKAYVPAGAQVSSLDAINTHPGNIQLYEDQADNGKRRLRAIVRHNGIGYDLSVPADAARTRFLTAGLGALQADVQAATQVHLRLGVSRPFAAMPNSCYAQVNGIYLL